MPQASTWLYSWPGPHATLCYCRCQSREHMSECEARWGRQRGRNRKTAFPLGRAPGSQASHNLGSSSQKVLPRGWAWGASYCSPGPSLWPFLLSVPLEGIWAFSVTWTQFDSATCRLSGLLGDPRLLGDSNNYITIAGLNVIQPWPSETSRASWIGKFLRTYGFPFVEIEM